MAITYLNLASGEVIKYYKVRAQTTTGYEVNTLVYAFSPEEVMKKFHKVLDIEEVVFFGPRESISGELHDLTSQIEASLRAIAEKASGSVCEDDVNAMKSLLEVAKEKLSRIEMLTNLIEAELYREEGKEAREKEEEKLKLQLEIARLKRELRELKKEEEEKKLGETLREGK